MNIYICHNGCKYEGGGSRGHFMSEESAVKFVEASIREDNKLYSEHLNSLDEAEREVYGGYFGPWEKKDNEEYLHCWEHCSDIWIIKKVEVAP